MDKRSEIQSLATKAILDCKFNGVIDCAPRVGKSKIVINALNQLVVAYKIVVSSPYTIISKNWKKEAKKWHCAHPLITICHASLKNLKSDTRILIIDEIQTLSPAQLQFLQKFRTQNPHIKILGISGTLSRWTMIGIRRYLRIEKKFEYTIEQAIEDKIISDYHINVVLCKLKDKYNTFRIDLKDRSFYKTEQAAYDYYNGKFNEFKAALESEDKKTREEAEENGYEKLKDWAVRQRKDVIYKSNSKVDSARKLIAGIKNRKCLIFTAYSTQAKMLAPYTYEQSSKKDDNLTKFIDGDIEKLAVCEMVNMGVTIPKLKRAVVHQVKSDEEMMWQKILRSCNLEGEKKAIIYLTVYEDTVDMNWLISSMNGVNKNKISFIREEDFWNGKLDIELQEKYVSLLNNG